jgi:ribosome assembly protein 1
MNGSGKRFSAYKLRLLFIICRWIIPSTTSTHLASAYDKGIIAGFNFATASGPLCAEPMMGLCFVIEDFQLQSTTADVNSFSITESDDRPNISEAARMGQVITAMKEACRQAFMKWSPRLMLAIYSCEIYASGN